MKIETSFDNFDDSETRLHLYVLVGFIRNVLFEFSDVLEDDAGVTLDTMQAVSDSLGEMVRYLTALNEETPHSATDIRHGAGPVPPSPGELDTEYDRATPPGAIIEYCWLVQQLVSIMEGTFTLRITKDSDGFRVMMDCSPTVVRYDTDVPFDVPEYASDIDFECDGEQYLDRAIWSQQRAATKLPDLLTKLDAEVPATHPDEASGRLDTLAPLYHDGGVTFRFARVGTTVSLAIDREADEVTPVRTLAKANVVV